MEVKSAMLLPKAKPDEAKVGRSAAQDLADPRYELVQQLLEYKRFKDTAVLLEKKQAEEHHGPVGLWTFREARASQCLNDGLRQHQKKDRKPDDTEAKQQLKEPVMGGRRFPSHEW